TYVVRRDNGWLATVNTLTYNDTPTAGDHSYVIRVWVGGGMQDISCQPDPITVTDDGGPPPAVQACAATINQGTVTLTWDAIAGGNAYQVRRDGAWLAGTGTLTYDDSPGAGSYEYVIRSRQGGKLTDTICSPNPVVVP
ncbi:MAG: hypothetical protein GY698_08255, partial [Actinomycetia bacterium]|nr:hypothetical protein [Actinomycetes bacterium]